MNILDMEFRLTDSLRLMFRKASKAQTKWMLAMMEHWVNEVKSLQVKASNEIDFAGNFNRAVDELVNNERNIYNNSKDIKCAKGCCYCCYDYVEISYPEAVLAVEYAKEVGVVVNVDRLEKQAACNDIEAWLQQPYEQQRCVFLTGEGGCGIYEHRPHVCRKLYVTSDPINCKVDESRGVMRWGAIEAEVAATCYATIVGVDSLPRMVKRVLGSK